MQRLSRREILFGGGALLGATAMPGISFLNSALAADMPRPDHIIRAGTNENPWGPSRVALNAIMQGIDSASQYGGRAYYNGILRLLSEQNDVPTSHITMGSGSGEILNVGGLLAGMETGSVVCADPTYHGLVRYAANVGSEIIKVPVDEDLNIDLEAMASAIRRDTRLVYLVNPNNPIPAVIEKNAMRDFVVEIAKDRLVFVDEAYFEFVDNPDYGTMMGLVRQGQKNLIVTRTASKIHGLAGLRIGFGFAYPDLINEIDNRKTGQINQLALRAAYASYQDQEFQDFTLRMNRESLDIVQGMLDELEIRYVPSNANFCFFDNNREVNAYNDVMLQHGIMSGRPFPPMTTWSRISMAKPDEMRYFVQTYKKLFG